MHSGKGRPMAHGPYATTAAELSSLARSFIPGGVNSGQRQVPGIEDLVIVGTSGSRVFTADGLELIDFHGAFGPTILGHNDPKVNEAVVGALKTIDNPGLGVTRNEVELAERIVHHIESIDQVLLTSTGSEATFHALRVARAATGRQKIIKFQGCYHGWHDSVAMNVASEGHMLGTRDPLSAGVLPGALDATLVVDFNDSAGLETVLDAHDGEVAAIIIEPIAHNIGCVVPEAGFLAEVRRLATKHGAVLIFDEVITGFRHALGGYQGIEGVTPDLTTLGKAIANGLPMGALGGREDLMQLFSTTRGKPVFFAGTYNGHPVVAAAASATLDRLASEPVIEHIHELGDRARVGLRRALSTLGVDFVVAGFGSIFVTYFMSGPVRTYTDLLRNDADMFVSYRLEQIKRGILEIPRNLKRSNISYAHTEDDVDRLVEASAAAVEKVLA